MPDSVRTFREKMLQQIEKAEAAQVAIDQWGQWAEEQVPQLANVELRALEISKQLNRDVYRNLVGGRNTSLQWAQVYGLAAQVDPYHGAVPT